jgi:Ca2+-binding EF-hand superfamily protein
MSRQERDQDIKYQEDLNRVEAAFRQFDTDGDGFIDWEEFKQVRIRDS